MPAASDTPTPIDPRPDARDASATVRAAMRANSRRRRAQEKERHERNARILRSTRPPGSFAG